MDIAWKQQGRAATDALKERAAGEQTELTDLVSASNLLAMASNLVAIAAASNPRTI